MTPEELESQGWIQTDGSANTLQYAKNVDETTWLYRQWLSTSEWDPRFDVDYKIANWDDDNWTELEVCAEDYSMMDIRDALETFGYQLVYLEYQPGYMVPKIIQGNDILRGQDAIQLICECLFESNV